MSDLDGAASSTLAPDEAFDAIGNETRIQILRALAETDGPQHFSALFDRVEYETASNFSYHLDRLTDHFVRKTEKGYEITRPGRRVVEAIRSGAVTDAPVIPPTVIDQKCHFCDAPVEVRYYDERFERFCTECPGMWGSKREGFLGSLTLPPVGVKVRDVEAAVEAAYLWRSLDLFAIAGGMCPQCSSRLAFEAIVCESHDDEGCAACGNRHAAKLWFECETCRFRLTGSLALLATSDEAFLSFLLDHGHHPVMPTSIADFHRIISDYDLDIVSAEPFEAVMTFSAGEDSTISFKIEDPTDVTVIG